MSELVTTSRGLDSTVTSRSAPTAVRKSASVSAERDQTRIRLIGRTTRMAATCSIASRPAPTRPNVLASGLASASVATAVAAAVRARVSTAPSMIARHSPVVESSTRMTERWVGSPRPRLSGASVRALTTDRFSRPEEATIGSMTELLTLLPRATGAGWDAWPGASSACAARTASDGLRQRHEAGKIVGGKDEGHRGPPGRVVGQCVPDGLRTGWTSPGRERVRDQDISGRDVHYSTHTTRLSPFRIQNVVRDPGNRSRRHPAAR